MIDLSDWEQANPADFRPIVQLASGNVSYKDLYNWWELKEFGTYLYLSGYDVASKTISLFTLRAWSNRWDMLSFYRHRAGAHYGASIKPGFPTLMVEHMKIGAFQGTSSVHIFKLPQELLIKAKIIMGDNIYIPTEEEFDIALNRGRRKQS